MASREPLAVSAASNALEEATVVPSESTEAAPTAARAIDDDMVLEGEEYDQEERYYADERVMTAKPQ